MLFTSCPARSSLRKRLSKGGYNSFSITAQALTSLAVLLLSVKLGKGYPLRTGLKAPRMRDGAGGAGLIKGLRVIAATGSES